MDIGCGEAALDTLIAEAAARARRHRASAAEPRTPRRGGSLPSTARFPVPLECPRCRRPMEIGSVCEQTGDLCMSFHAGVPRVLFGQDYWGEIGAQTMRRVLDEGRRSHWRTALERCIPEEPVTAHLLDPIRADFLHAMPWNRIHDVLDVGAGMGFMSCDMAAYARNVIALEAVPERAEFIRLRARQDQLNVFPIIASAMAAPFPAESFDLITLNGVFEYVGLWGEGDPRRLQEEFLRNTLRLLRPGGYLYIGIESRFGAGAFRGNRDHSGFAYTSLMPRRIADLYCRLRAKPFYGSETVATGYRTYTHTPRQYRRMLERAGYANVSVRGVFEGYNRQKILWDLDDRVGRNALLDRVNPAASFAGRLRRLLTDNRALYRLLEDHVVLFAQKPRVDFASPVLPWHEVVTAGRSVVQLNQNFKTLAVVCDNGVPVEILEAEKKAHPEAGERLRHSFEVLTRLQADLHGEIPAMPMRWPEPRGSARICGRSYRRYEFVPGHLLATQLLPARYDVALVPALFTRAIQAYVELSRRLTHSVHGTRGVGESEWQTVGALLDSVEVGADIRGDFRRAVRNATAADWRLSVVHGDFSPVNLVVTPAGALVLLDWEFVTAAYPLGADLLRFEEAGILESARLPAAARIAFRTQLADAVASALQSLGYTSADRRHLDALFIASQIAARGSERLTYRPLLDAYRARRRRSETPGAGADAGASSGGSAWTPRVRKG
jgi:SAM-dependent methyltransferase/aminoglycoside phosphotransferase (APT) family kinase protein